MVTKGGAVRRTPLADAVEMLDNAVETRLVCLGAEGFWLVDGGAEPSLDHILDLSDVKPRNPRTNASIAKATIETWPDDPSQFAVELVMVSIANPCPCCGHLTLDEPPGSFSICAVCFWEDDAVQLRWPTMEGGANRPSLIDAQAAYAEHGAMEGRWVANVRAPRHDEPVEEGWRRIDLDRDSFEALDDRSAEWPDDVTRFVLVAPQLLARTAGLSLLHLNARPAARGPSTRRREHTAGIRGLRSDTRDDVRMEISRRLTHWIDREFPKGASEKVLVVLRDLPDGVIGGQDPERIQASLVIRSGGDWDAFQRRLELAHSDWRDALVGAGLGNEDWRLRLTEVLGTDE